VRKPIIIVYMDFNGFSITAFSSTLRRGEECLVLGGQLLAHGLGKEIGDGVAIRQLQ